jgi:hypothetical protein
MSKPSWIAIALLLAVAGPATAQTACPTDGSCPVDVGACITEACPCAADADGVSWRNHGQYVKCVAHLRNDLRKAGCLDADAKRTIASCAARSTCGKEGAVLCCTYDTSATCDGDPLPGDGTAAGTCSDSGETPVACDTATDCISVAKGPKVTRDADSCAARGGTVVGTGSVCSGCPLPPPAP